MSRSYNKFPVFKERHHRRTPLSMKTIMNRRVRRRKEIPTGKSGYKKLYIGYDMRGDYRYVDCMNETDVMNQWENEEYFFRNCDTYKEALWIWKKYYIRK